MVEKLATACLAIPAAVALATLAKFVFMQTCVAQLSACLRSTCAVCLAVALALFAATTSRFARVSLLCLFGPWHDPFMGKYDHAYSARNAGSICSSTFAADICAGTDRLGLAIPAF
jgi:hypothetical protein